MLRRWCISLATLGLAVGAAVAAPAAGGALAASHPTLTTTSHTVAVTHGGIRPGGVAVHVVRPGTPLTAHSGIRNESTSTNWSGYAADSGTYTSVSATWVEPKGTCSGRSDEYSSFWVGLDGYSSDTVEQTGTDTDCDGSTPSYYGWYETYPNPSYSFGDTIEPGDTISASVTYEGSSKFVYTLADKTRDWSVSTTQTESGADRSSAEVIIEAPCCTDSGGILPLADFGTVNISDSQVDGSAIGNSDPAEIIMVDSSGKDKDTVSSLTSGENFSATWERSN
jgi:Peptidase A4 family